MLVGGQCHVPAALPPGKTRYPWYRGLGGPQGRCHMQYSHWLTALVVTFFTLVQDILVVLYLYRYVVGQHRLSLGRQHVRDILTKSCLSLYYWRAGIVNGLWYLEALFFVIGCIIKTLHFGRSLCFCP